MKLLVFMYDEAKSTSCQGFKNALKLVCFCVFQDYAVTPCHKPIEVVPLGISTGWLKKFILNLVKLVENN